MKSHFTKSEFIEKLKTALAGELPSIKAHRYMSYRNMNYPKEYSHLKQAAVQIIIYGESHHKFLMIQRPSYKGVHSGQMAFPGGKYDKSDKDLLHTSIRETKEEIGLTIKDHHILGSLSEIVIDVSGFVVFPFVSYQSNIPNLTKSDYEVESIYHFDMLDFFDDKYKSIHKLNYKGNTLEVNCYQIQGKTIWGASAMMLYELEMMVRSIFVQT